MVLRLLNLFFRLFICLSFFSLLSNIGCQSFLQRYTSPKDNIKPPGQNQELPSIIATDAYINPLLTRIKEYKINPSDLLEISVYQEPDLNKIIRVSQDGYISFPLIGKVKIEGITVIEAEEKIAALLGQDYLINPQVTVFIKEYYSKKVVIMGEVKRPGSYEFPQGRDLTVLEAIALAGGFSNVAAIDKTKVIRVENGIQKYIQIKITDITQGGDKSKDIILKPNDIIFVPERIF